MKNYEKYISKSAIEKIHEKSLYILENIGVQVEHDKACALLKQHGAQVEGHLVRLSAEMVDACLLYTSVWPVMWLSVSKPIQ